MRYAYYKNLSPTGLDAPSTVVFSSFEEMIRTARAAWTEGGEGDWHLVFDVQPGDRTRYRMSLSKDYGSRLFVFSMLGPTTTHAVEYDETGPPPDIHDTPFGGMNHYTAAVYVDVLRGVVWGETKRRYDYARSRPYALFPATLSPDKPAVGDVANLLDPQPGSDPLP